MTHKLNDTFNIDGGDENDETVVQVYDIEIPADAKLSDISKLALEAYKQQMENIQHLEPQYRARSLEVAKQYLELAKSAIADDIKFQQAEKKLGPGDPEDEEGEGKDKGDSSGYSRHELLHALQNSGPKKDDEKEENGSG